MAEVARQEERGGLNCGICCVRVLRGGGPGLAAALDEGWTELDRDDGPSWNFLGVCPECQQEERDKLPIERRKAEVSGRGEVGSTVESSPGRVEEAGAAACAEEPRPRRDGEESACIAVLEAPTEVSSIEKDARVMELTTEELQRARAEGVTTALRLRRIEKNKRRDAGERTLF